MKNILKLKNELKSLAKSIKETKLSRKEPNRNGESLWKIQSRCDSLSYDFRHKHIAYCLLRGRTMEQIEKPREGNEPSQHYIDKYMEEYAWEPREEEVAA